jgi:hypothetical protein
MKATYNDEASKKAAVNAYIEKIRKAREEKTASRAAKKAATTTVKKPRKAKVTANAVPTGNGAPASTTAKRSKREAPTEKEGKLKENQLAAKKRLNNALGIKSMPPEFLPIMTIMRKTNISESEKKTAIDAQIEKVRKAREEKAAAKKKPASGGSRTRKNRRS